MQQQEKNAEKDELGVDRTLPVSEIFYSLQGEGPTMGYPAVFLRLQSCNLMCGGNGTEKDGKLHNDATWRCDTIEVWLVGTKKKFADVVSSEFVERLRDGAHLIVTGGEPLIHQRLLYYYFVWFLKTYKFLPYIEVETNGTIAPNVNIHSAVKQWNVSPKLKNSGMSKKRRIRLDVLKKFNNLPSVYFKFVITDRNDWTEIITDILPQIDRNKVWLMPGCSSIKQLLEVNQMVAAISVENNLKFSTRLQVEIWDKTTGV
jgi:7-carboxy-7-deazaguanine synthase